MSTSIVNQYDFDYRVAQSFAAPETIWELQERVTDFVALEHAPAETPTLYQDVALAINRLVAAIQTCEEAGVEPNIIRAWLTPARQLHRRSLFVARAQDWPRGYAGDFETIEYLCDGINRVNVEDAVGRCVEEFTLNSSIVQQHRNKVAVQAEMMLRCCESKQGARVLSIGCGGARDLRMIAATLQDSDAEFVLCDADADALQFASVELESLRERCTLVHGKVPRVINRLKSFDSFDLVIAGGLFDYLPDRWVELMVGDIWHLLNPEGRLFFTNIAINNPYRWWMEYLADWSLIERSEGDIERLCRNAGVDEGAVSITREATGLTLIAKIDKPGTALVDLDRS